MLQGGVKHRKSVSLHRASDEKIQTDLTHNGTWEYDEGYDDGYGDGHLDGQDIGYDNGYDDGHQDGHDLGLETGHDAGYDNGYDDGYTDGYDDGHLDGDGVGYEDGFVDGEDAGFDRGIAAGGEIAYNNGHADGYDEGYGDGYEDCDLDAYEEGYVDGHTDGQAGTSDNYGGEHDHIGDLVNLPVVPVIDEPPTQELIDECNDHREIHSSSCRWFGCNANRGDTECIDAKCWCVPGQCTDGVRCFAARDWERERAETANGGRRRRQQR